GAGMAVTLRAAHATNQTNEAEARFHLFFMGDAFHSYDRLAFDGFLAWTSNVKHARGVYARQPFQGNPSIGGGNCDFRRQMFALVAPAVLEMRHKSRVR